MKKIIVVILALTMTLFVAFCSDSTKSSNPSESLKYKGNWSTNPGLSDSVFFSIVQIGDSAKINTYHIVTENSDDSMYATEGICFVTSDHFEFDDEMTKLTGDALADTILSGEYIIYDQISGDSIIGGYTAYKQ